MCAGEWVSQRTSRCWVAKWPGRQVDKWANGHGGERKGCRLGGQGIWTGPFQTDV